MCGGGVTAAVHFDDVGDFVEAAIVVFRRRRKRWAVEYKGGKCQKCGYCKCIRALEFHHEDIKDRSTNANRGGLDFSISLARLKVELDKCLLVCANCHREIEEEIDVTQKQKATNAAAH